MKFIIMREWMNYSTKEHVYTNKNNARKQMQRMRVRGLRVWTLIEYSKGK